MSAEVLRRAAALMRERAEASKALTIDQGLNWWGTEGITRAFDALAEAKNYPIEGIAEDASHISSWHPDVALAVAKALDDAAQGWEIADGWGTDLDGHPIRFEDTIDGGWLDVARAYLGETS